MNIRIGIIDDHPAMVLGTTALFAAEPGVQVAASGATVTELLTWRLKLDVVLLDLVLADGSSPAENIRRLHPVGARVLAYTSGDRAHLVREAARAGAIGMIRKTEDPAAIVAAVRRAAAGEPVATVDWAAALDSDVPFVSSKLTPREAEVLTLYASGETADQVAAALFVSTATIHDHIRRIRAKYAASDRAAPTKVDLFRRAVEDGLVPPQ
ncbi:MAG: response regulator transcription factor [Candidatus Microbacterium phytovorans]|uniref:Response regulator transcription factor n=1 Tax=Candidatus Microbacterium phytovorans TaxID=3121374 RepID=A0AAJ5VZ01_9MICO|nr:response regulator transcription factor [Microbacterium sp.]WEK12864.1 MAG: response regulator transcription factor [Microbacterium sp.]